eukprot:scaffold218504_cov36-Tisochrysis_lutea.AAC.3
MVNVGIPLLSQIAYISASSAPTSTPLMPARSRLATQFRANGAIDAEANETKMSVPGSRVLSGGGSFDAPPFARASIFAASDAGPGIGLTGFSTTGRARAEMPPALAGVAVAAATCPTICAAETAPLARGAPSRAAF